ncbi:MAG: hypothetical protein IT271_12570 [Chitinophagales bacterium]|nr:hypothetical protein [Chitinophagales bacterium]
MSATQYYPDNCEDLDEVYDCINCDELVEKARVRHVGTVKTSYLATLLAGLLDSAVWATGIANGDIKLIPDVIGTWNGGVPKEEAGYGDQTSSISAYEHEVAFKDQRYKGNDTFYDSLAKAKNNVFFFATETLIHFGTKPVTILPKSPVSDNTTDKVNWDVMAKWSEKSLLKQHDRLDAILNCAFIAAQL